MKVIGLKIRTYPMTLKIPYIELLKFYQKGDDHMSLLMLLAYLPELWFVATQATLQAIGWGVISTLLTIFCICAEIDEKKRTSRH